MSVTNSNRVFHSVNKHSLTHDVKEERCEFFPTKPRHQEYTNKILPLSEFADFSLKKAIIYLAGLMTLCCLRYTQTLPSPIPQKPFLLFCCEIKETRVGQRLNQTV
ncbi:hypothetical protein TNCV_4230381 [Trichonephila clavipes]|uniref:Uncharacterized protein n=1 Tax=Trichonephila clavipes TaxID=2585209 RepID=A0A8X6VG85_TRICX|nr:hypothetical protein TNCV_4230381 [Trichonephila clavipes]